MRQLIAIIDVYADCTLMIYFATTRVLYTYTRAVTSLYFSLIRYLLKSSSCVLVGSMLRMVIEMGVHCEL